MINIKKKDYKNIVDKAIEHQYTIDVLSKLISKPNNMNGGEIENKNKNVLSNEYNDETSISSLFKKKEN